MSTPCPQCGRVSVSGQVHHLCPHGITCRTEGPCLVCEHDMRGAPLPKHLAALLLGSTRRQRRVIARAGTTGRRDARRVLPRPRGASPISVLVASFMLRRQMALDFADAIERLGPVAIPDGVRLEFVVPGRIDRVEFDITAT